MIDIIVCHPYEIQYPVWEKMMRINKSYYNQLIVCFTKGKIIDRDYSQEIKERLPACYLDSPKVGQILPESDWRHTAVNFALDHTIADYVLFMEQDFLIPDLSILKDYDGETLGIMEGERIHPAFLMVKKEVVYSTDRNFAAYPEEGLDHFDKFTSQLPEIDIMPDDFYYHLAGFTHNEKLVAQDGKPNYKPDEYKLFKIMEKLLC